MKIFILAVAVMLVTGVFIGWAGWYVGRVCGELIGILEALPEKSGDLSAFGVHYRAFEKRWYEMERLLVPIVGRGATEIVEQQFVEMGMRYIGGDDVGYCVAVKQLKLQLENIRDGEKITLDGIL